MMDNVPFRDKPCNLNNLPTIGCRSHDNNCNAIEYYTVVSTATDIILVRFGASERFIVCMTEFAYNSKPFCALVHNI